MPVIHSELPPSVTFRFYHGGDADILQVGTIEAVKSWLATKTAEEPIFPYLMAAYDLALGALYDVEGLEQTHATYKLYREKAAEILCFDFPVSQNDCALALGKIGNATEAAGAVAGFDLFIVFLGESGFFT